MDDAKEEMEKLAKKQAKADDELRQLVQNLEGMGFTVVPFGQGFKDMNPPTKELMKLTLEKKLAHGGNHYGTRPCNSLW